MEQNTKFIHTQSINNRSVNPSNVVEGFILAVLILFVVLEEADWLCVSAHNKNDDIIEYESPWDMNKLLPFNTSSN